MRYGKGDVFMARMYRVLGFWSLVIGLMALAGNLVEMGLLFLFKTVVFVSLGYMNLSERSYMLIFWGYLVVSFTGYTFWTFLGWDM